MQDDSLKLCKEILVSPRTFLPGDIMALCMAITREHSYRGLLALYERWKEEINNEPETVKTAIIDTFRRRRAEVDAARMAEKKRTHYMPPPRKRR